MLNMKYSKSGFALTERFEGCRRDAYQDSVGVWTIGYGHTRGVKKGDYCSMDQAMAWLVEDTESSEKNVSTHITIPDVTQGEFDALVDFDFNLGDNALNKSTLLRLYNHEDKAAAAEEFEKWDHAGGRVIAGLLRRRLEEKQMFLGTEEKEG